MEWINIADQEPDKYQEVIICSNDDTVKSAIYMGNGKWNTYLKIDCWQPFPKAPKRKIVTTTEEKPIKKKRGRPKKV